MAESGFSCFYKHWVTDPQHFQTYSIPNPYFCVSKVFEVVRLFSSSLGRERLSCTHGQVFATLWPRDISYVSDVFLIHWRKLFKESVIQDVWLWLFLYMNFREREFLSSIPPDEHIFLFANPCCFSRWQMLCICQSSSHATNTDKSTQIRRCDSEVTEAENTVGHEFLGS